jgi:hypothetical protein
MKRQRKLTTTESVLFRRLWRWKVLSYPLAKSLVFKEIKYGTFYKKIRRLLDEGYILEWRGSAFPFDLLHLSKKGFDALKYDLGELREERFAPQSVVHDYWATAIQLGEFVHKIPDEIKFFTEQQLQCTDDCHLPQWVPKSRNHVPDGLTKIKYGEQSRVVAFEVELNLKAFIRYDKAAYYFDAGLSNFDVVIWLCANDWIINKITARLKSLRLRNHDVHQFILTSDFQANGWDAKITKGSLTGQTLSEIYMAKSWIEAGSTLDQPWITRSAEIYFPKLKSPNGIKSYQKRASPPNS